MKFITEQDSINYFVNRLKTKGWENIVATQSTDKYSYYDVSAEYKGKKVRFELKRRNMLSSTFGDSIIELWKHNHFICGLNNGEFDKCFVVSFFDDIFTVSDITKPMFKDIVIASKTTEFENNEKIEKIMVHYEQEIKLNYE